MQSINTLNKCLIYFEANNCRLIEGIIRAKHILYKPRNRCLNSWIITTKLKPLTCVERQRSHCMRCLSTKESLKTDPKTSTTTTNASPKQRPPEETTGPVMGSAGIAGIYKWDIHKKVKAEEWIGCYHFPYIAQMRFVQRLKVYVTVLCGVLVPVSYTLYALGMKTLESCHMSTLVGLFSLAMLYVFGFFFRQLVGRVYISRDESMVRLSHLSFFGNRVDTEVEASDVVPLAVSNDRLNDFFCRIERFSCDDLLYMSLKYGGVVNREAFEQVFGKNSAIGSRK